MQALEFGFGGSEFRVCGLGFEIQGSRSRCLGSGGLEFKYWVLE